MGSQHSISRHPHQLPDQHESGIPGLPAIPAYGVNTADPCHGGFGPASPALHPPVNRHGPDVDNFMADDPGGSCEPNESTVVSEQSPVVPLDNTELIPCVFTWTQGGHNVYLTGSFNNWSVDKKIRLVRSGHEFSAIQELQRGVHLYKFIVDDQWRYAAVQHTQRDDHGNINNVLDISRYTNFKFCLRTDDDTNLQYHQMGPEFHYSPDATTMPILLSKSSTVPPRHTIPLSCISNHLYRDSHPFGSYISVIAATQRWRISAGFDYVGQRYTTYIYICLNPGYPEASINAASTASPAEVDTNTINPLMNMFAVRRRGGGDSAAVPM